MRDRHVRIGRGTLRFEFRGKSGKNHEIDLHDPRLAAIVRQAQDLPGQDLFQYLDENDEPQKIGSSDVNEYLREIAGEEFSAKDFRTWAGTVLAAIVLREFEKFETKKQAKKNLVQAIERVASRLGNTPAVCKKCYIHPGRDGQLSGRSNAAAARSQSRRRDQTRPDEIECGGAGGAGFPEKRLKEKTRKEAAGTIWRKA